MRFWNDLLHALAQASQHVRLWLVLCGFAVCVLLQFSALIFLHSFAVSAMFAMPAVLAAWMFKWRGAILGVGMSLLVLMITDTLLTGTILWPFPLALPFLVDSLVITIMTFSLVMVRNGFDLAYGMHLQREKAQAQIALASKRQQQLDQLKEHILLNVSHELRTPLTVLSGYLELLREYQDELEASAQKEMLDLAFLSCEELQHIVEMMLEVAQVDHAIQEPRREEIALAELIHMVVTALDPQSRQDHEVSVQEIPEQWMVQADRQHVHQILRNLLTNAFKYTPPQTLVRISAYWEHEGAADTTSSSLVVCVQDAGPGIAPEYIPLLFQKFVRLPQDLTGSVRGTGLGLYICQQLVERMGGRIWVESSGIAGEGCSFYFALPSGAPRKQS